jgi:hypothetical protein
LSNFLLQEKQIEKSVPPSRMYTNAFIDEINQYDRAAVIQKAREFDLSTVR